MEEDTAGRAQDAWPHGRQQGNAALVCLVKWVSHEPPSADRALWLYKVCVSLG